MIESNATIAIKGGGLITSSSVMAEMVIFNDPAYMLLAIAGAILSFGGMVHEMLTKKLGFSIGSVFANLLKATVLGGILTPMFFMIFIHTGGSLISQIVGLDGLKGIFNSFWWLLSLLTAWYSFIIWDWIVRIIKKKSSKRLDDGN